LTPSGTVAAVFLLLNEFIFNSLNFIIYHTKYAADNVANSAPADVNTLVKLALSNPLDGIVMVTVEAMPVIPVNEVTAGVHKYVSTSLNQIALGGISY
jgi:hypothetical protein